MRALRIAPDTTVTELDLPATGAHSAIQDHIGTTDAVDQSVYHGRALLHIHGNGRTIGLAQNTAAWALASAWRGTALYPIHGPVIVTGRAQDGGAAAGTTAWPSTRTRSRRPYGRHWGSGAPGRPRPTKRP
ncbi:hypothetical protein [Streptomyces sp. NPDC002088]|uniref:hypothetical protein n=1 Tax=Streptomyces sp. NPDC002088 TaxID=3154665 RepID=UPI00331BF9E4